MGISLRIERRAYAPLWLRIGIPLLSVLLSLMIAALMFHLEGIDPLTAYRIIFLSSFGSPKGLSYSVVKMIPLLLCGVGLILAFKANVWNIGAEGQIIVGAIAATWVALFLVPNAPSYVVIPLMFIMGFLAGGLWALIAGILRGKFNVNEVIVTLMMNHIASKITEYLIYGPWMGKTTWGFPESDPFSESAHLPLIPGTYIHYPTLIIAVIAALLSAVLLSYTKPGYEMKVLGLNPEAARYAGISYVRTIALVMFLSGGLAGIAGVGEVAGLHHRLRYPWAISSGYGYTAMLVAWLSRLNCLVAIPVSFLLGALLVGGDAIQISLNLSVNIVYIFNGLILLCLAGGEVLTRYRIRLRRE